MNKLKEKIRKVFIRDNGTITSISKERYFKKWEENIYLISDIKEVTSFLGTNDDNIPLRIKFILSDLTDIPKCLGCECDAKVKNLFTHKDHSGYCGKICYNKHTNNVNRSPRPLLEPRNEISYNRLSDISDIITSLSDYKGRNSSVSIRCVICAKIYNTKASKEFYASNPGTCNNCNSNITKPIIEICKYLDDNDIKYVLEKRFHDCINPNTNYVLPFDIFLYEKNTIIEYDGIHHYEEIYKDSNLKDVQYRDKIKTEYCKNNNLTLIRIPYMVNSPITYLKHIPKINDEIITYTYDMYDEDVKSLSQHIESYGYKNYVLVSLYRGSIPIVHRITLSTGAIQQYGIIKFQSYDGNDKVAKILTMPDIPKDCALFIVDDIYDSGNTMKKVDKLLNKKYPSYDRHYITIYGKENKEGVYYLRTNDKFVHFEPWE